MKVRIFQDPKEKKRRGPKSCPWSVEWRENGRRRSRTIGTKEQAKDFAAVKQAELLDASMGITVKKRWDDFVEEYLADLADSGSRLATVEIAERVLNNFAAIIAPKWVHRIDGKTLDAYRAKRMKSLGVHGDPISPETVKKELRHLRAALGVAARWGYLRIIPSLPKIKVDERDKPHVTEEHFLAMLRACEEARLPAPSLHPSLPPDATPGDFWRALLVTLWVTGARIDAVLRLRWEDVDFRAGRVLSRAADLKQRKDTRPVIAGAMPYLIRIRGADPRLLPWNHHRRTLYAAFYELQRAAGVVLLCPKAHVAGHTCGEACTLYGFHAFRYAHARFNADNPELQNQMGHATRATTDHYRRWAERRLADYQPYMPPGLAGPKQRENDGKESGNGPF